MIVITGHDEPGTEERVRALGACAYLKKPVERDVLFAALTDANSQFEMPAQPPRHV